MFNMPKKDRDTLARLIGRNGFRDIMYELKHYAFSHIGTGSHLWPVWYTGIGRLIAQRDKENDPVTGGDRL